MDFTLKTYRNLLFTLKQKNYFFLPFANYINGNNSQTDSGSHQRRAGSSGMTVILRHDVDRKPKNALEIAKLEKELGINGTYYFRIVPESFNEKIIKEIEAIGHEIGYHYEEIDLVLRSKMRNERREILRFTQNDKGQRTKNQGLDIIIDQAWEMFQQNLVRIREVAEITTICPHGSPLSRFDNKLLWEKYNYNELGIIGDAHLDTDWDQFGYLTDTGRRWNGDSVSVRDKVKSNNNFNFKSTFDIINNMDKLPDKVMFNIHPERWNDNYLLWLDAFISQNVKNVVKKYFYVKKNEYQI